MNLKKILNKDVVELELPGSNKREVIESLLDILVETGKVKDRDAALSCLLQREDKMSTGLQNGIAIPHGKTDAVDELIACIAVKPEGIDFQSLDGVPSTIFIMTLSPLNRTGPHIQFLAEVGQLLKDGAARKKVLEAGTKDDILDILIR